MPSPTYTVALLHHLATENNITLLETYSRCNATTTIRFLCKCGKEGDKKMRSIVDQAGFTCKTCAIQKRFDNMIDTNLERYGVPYTGNIPEFKAKRDVTMMERYGVKHPSLSPDIIEKVKALNFKKYGTTCTTQAPEIKKKIKETWIANYGVDHPFKSESVKSKIKQSNIERYGVEYASASPVIKEKVINTNLERYGVKHALQSSEVREKIYETNYKRYGGKMPQASKVIREKTKDTCLKKYGVTHFMKLDTFKEKCKETILKRFGVRHPMLDPAVRKKQIERSMAKYGVPYPCQSPEIGKKIYANAKKYKRFTMPSGEIRLVQGYEPFALTELLKIYSEEEIITDRNDVPRISYTKDNKSRVYFPDIFIPKYNKIIEVKSTWTYEINLVKNQIKRQACIDAGYDYELMCYDGTGKRVSI